MPMRGAQWRPNRISNERSRSGAGGGLKAGAAAEGGGAIRVSVDSTVRSPQCGHGTVSPGCIGRNSISPPQREQRRLRNFFSINGAAGLGSRAGGADGVVGTGAVATGGSGGGTAGRMGG